MKDQSNLLPLYEQVRRSLLAGIETGQFAEGSFLPAEPELMACYSVSRITLRRAIGELCADGRLQRQQGRGTIVMPGKMRQTLVSLSGFSETMDGLGRKASHRILARVDNPEAPAIQARLQAGALIRFDRLLEDNGLPMTLETLWFDPLRFSQVIEPVAAGGSFFASLRDKAGIEPAHAERQIDVGFASASERAILAVTATQPVYRIEKIVTDAEERPLALSQLITPSHLVTYTIKS
ncbi:GntR family transcriptional regulator [Phyllobacterium sp. 21LDTY02-6]|uniref:GntR family transcriptional regulator n=1 Tax=unclassified Phyllobacterium TaxID=2638441 RepID=UPI0020207458|nr:MULTISPECIES: GntR family transcriptional regulator [unclassified Phyllobacterium]MCO4317867.1 GntR family transcriptional regulator [Phyllobacterium sp. 21LDTY02-6]MCX8282050.1 GntR family transcriptional regulator [Phyllobacterium sp. 0TCS1.6C]MCX8296258.1 GntR family transcriptional regulator [Phyllobacterium sp. 0TCS1.6A]